MSITFKDKTEAMEYARQKQKEGYAVDICGGEKGNYGYIVTIGKKVKRSAKGSAFSPYIEREEVYTKETNNHMLKRIEETGARKLRNKNNIIRIAKKEFKKNGYKKVKVEIKDIGDRDGMSDAEVESKNGIVNLAIHPIHQYTTNGNFKATLEHEINHLEKGIKDAKV